MKIKNVNKLSILFAISIFLAACSEKTETTDQPASNDPADSVSKIEYPYEFKYEGNPLSRIHGAADPDVNVWDGVV